MAGPWRDPAAFRPDPSVAPASRPSRRQALALLVALVVVAGAAVAASWFVSPQRSRSFDLFHGSVFLADSVAPVGVDLTTGRPTVRLVDANTLVGARRASDLAVTPLHNATLLHNRSTGQFDMIDPTGFVVRNTGGVRLPVRAGLTSTTGVAARDFAYLAQTGPAGSAVYLVGATTIQSAAGPGATVEPRAFRALPESFGSAPGTLAGSGNDLWLLTGTGATRGVRHLHLPAGSAPGATLTSSEHGTVRGPAALASTGDTGGVVAVASGRSLDVFHGDRRIRTLRLPTITGLDTVLPANDATDRLSFLLHGADGWRLVSARTDGTSLRVVRLTSIAATAELIPPATSNGALYTMDKTSGQVIRVTEDGHAGAVPGVTRYPLTRQHGRVIESGNVADAYVVARGSRVVINSPSHLQAIALFTDGSHAPVTIEKNAAVAVNASGGAAALARSRLAGNPRGKPVRGPAPPRVPVNNTVDCAATSQKPNIPVFGTPVPGSRSVLLNWSYPVTTTADCVPTTYVVAVRALTDGAPQPPARVTVQGQRSVNLTGLAPSTRYELTVTAFINGTGTTSTPIQVTTGVAGPNAPGAVTVSTDTGGAWNLSWASCGAASDTCQPAASWRVIPQFCDGRGLSTPPGPFEVAADPTSRTQPGLRVPASTALLGRGLTFQVEGIGTAGQVGAPSGTTACSTSWNTPITSALRLTASAPARTAFGGTATSVVSLDLGTDAVRNVGGVGAQITLRLVGGDGSASSRPVVFTGRGTTVSTTFTNVRAGVAYQASATVVPPGHPANGATVGPVPVSTTSGWPGLSLTPSCTPNGGAVQTTCDLSVRVNGLSGLAGERFDTIDTDREQSQLRCTSGGTRKLLATSVDLSRSTITAPGLSLLDFNGTCGVTLVLRESADSPSKVLGGVPSTPISANFTIGGASTFGGKATDFSAVWDQSAGGSQATVKYQGSLTDDDLGAITTGWSVAIHAPNGDACGSADIRPTHAGVHAAADTSCVSAQGDKSGWSVTITYSDRGGGQTHTIPGVALDGTAPGFPQCAADDFTASWQQDGGVSVTLTQGDTAGCGDWKWTYTLAAPEDSSCTSTSTLPAPSDTPVTVPVNCGATPSSGWTMTITWQSPSGSTNGIKSEFVTGDPPS